MSSYNGPLLQLPAEAFHRWWATMTDGEMFAWLESSGQVEPLVPAMYRVYEMRRYAAQVVLWSAARSSSPAERRRGLLEYRRHMKLADRALEGLLDMIDAAGREVVKRSR